MSEKQSFARGTCGYGNGVDQALFPSMVSTGGPSLFKAGKGCGACYEVKCTENAACSGNPVTVVITDECPAMANLGKANELRNAGVLQIQWQRVECNFPGVKATFHVDSGSNPNPNYFAALIEYEDGDGKLGAVNLKQALHSDSWLPMQHLWGAVWKLDGAGQLRALFSIKLTSLDSGKTLVANNVIPTGWQPGQTYRSVVNYAV
ncbi:hypothetical protein EUGRSUZ_E01626 [Eucalyptus grandis]|uniref:Uncharacterized protein n=2 Tax=Eucalyptus grandis TaxID=71139 RepID=A0ACC3KUM6_EUCGR|nr:hypothetical protein EUGRSUZ_E01626 [Eucalyptus grandis]